MSLPKKISDIEIICKVGCLLLSRQDNSSSPNSQDSLLPTGFEETEVLCKTLPQERGIICELPSVLVHDDVHDMSLSRFLMPLFDTLIPLQCLFSLPLTMLEPLSRREILQEMVTPSYSFSLTLILTSMYHY